MIRIFILIFLILTTPVLAQEDLGPDFTRVGKGDFQLYYSKTNPNINRSIALLVLNKFQQDYRLCLEKELKCVFKPDQPKTIIIYSSREQFKKSNSLLKNIEASTIACTVHDDNAILIDGESFNRTPYLFWDILSHEVGHLATHDFCYKSNPKYNLPSSIDEGLARREKK